jgi:ribonuclease E
MTIEKKTENEKAGLKIKARIGAWWKSTVLAEPPAEDIGDGRLVPDAEPETVRTERKTPRKRSPRKKPAVNRSGSSASEPQSDEITNPDLNLETEITELPAEESGVVNKKPAAKKPRRRKQWKKEDKSEEDVDQEGKPAETEDSAVAKSSPEPRKGKEPSKPSPVRKLLINAEEPEECRIALVEDGRLESIHVSSVTRTRTKNNIYKAKIVAIEPSLQAAFVDYGTDKNGFLPFSEIHPEYYKEELGDRVRELVEAHHWKKLNIVDVIEKGQEILAQVVKEEVGRKGANMTTYLSLPGRCVVLMPGSDSSGISRKISGEEKRSRLRDAMNATDIPEGIGWIVRTASIDITKTALSRDVGYLLRLWDEVKKKGQSLDGVGIVYEDHHNVLMFLREHFDSTIVEILVDDRAAMDEVKGFIDLLPSKQRDVKVRLHRGSRPIFNQFSVEDQIESIYQPQVNLPSGGSIVIDPTEALVAIDVNSGSTSKGKNFEQSIFQANMEAASELARQLRLRDLGGLIVVDFIDMRIRKNNLAVEREVKASMKLDKAKVDFSRISKFGLMQISRQKLGAPIEAGNYRVCEHCKGRGTVRSIETLALFYLRRIQTGASRKLVAHVECHFPLDVASYLLNNKREELYSMETKYKVEITIVAETSMKPADNNLIFHRSEKDVKDSKQP